jgi:glyceraldehyde-3-phosphate dehydrogenase (NADP+) (phosphorylating)
MSLSVSSVTGLRAGSARVASKQAAPAAFSGLARNASVHQVGAAVDSAVAFAQATRATRSVSAAAGKQVTQAKVKVAINGFGRIGRMFLRCVVGRGDSCPLEVIAVNDSGGVKQASHLLKYDSTMGTFDADVVITGDDTMTVNGKTVKVVSGRDPAALPWKELGVEVVIEGTGVFIDQAGAGKHLQAGAKKVVITAPAKDKDTPTFVMGVNEEGLKPDMHIVSNASCTTNCLAPFAKIINDKFGIVKGTMTTTHSYTGDQRLLDASHRDLRRARAAALNIVPTSTGAAKAVALVVPELKGKLNGIALRVPTPTVSIVDLVCQVEKKTMAEEVNAAFKAGAEGRQKGILAITDTPLVSMDFKKTDVSVTVDAALTMVMGDDMVKVVAWYDNEWGYSQRVVDLACLVAQYV